MTADLAIAWLEEREAVLRFAFDERLKTLLRAIPGRRWDPHERVWRVPLTPESAESVAGWLAEPVLAARVAPELEAALEAQRGARDHDECLIELVRFDEDRWLTFCADVPGEPVAALLAHPRTVTLPTVVRVLVPLDDDAAELARVACLDHPCAWLSPAAERAVAERQGRSVSVPSGAAPLEAVSRTDVSVARVDGEPVFVLSGTPVASLRAHAVRSPAGWTLALSAASWTVITQHARGRMTRAAARCVAALERAEAPPAAVLELSAVHAEPTFVFAPGYDTTALEQLGATAMERRPSRHEHGALPTLRVDAYSVPTLEAFLAHEGVVCSAQAAPHLEAIRDEHAQAAAIVERSQATDAPLHISGLGGELEPFQRAGVRYLLERRRVFLADEQGLGKTIEAIAALEHDGAYPAIVVCPASLKRNWERELKHWVPHRGVELVNGRDGMLGGAEVTIVNYEIVEGRLEGLRALAPRALVIDESHYCKNTKAKRTKAVTRLATAVPEDGLVLALTGTPVMNHASELIAQLRILGRLREFGSGRAFDERFRGPDAHQRLHWHLRARCLARRVKADVLPQLPAKRRSVVPIELDNDREYRLAEADVIAWLRSQPLDLRELGARVAAALRAERLVRLGALKLLAARGKQRAALTWIHDFLASGERLVVFARHREIQQGIVERFPRALHLLGSDSQAERDRTLAAFQAPDNPSNQLIVCSLAVAGQGLTLTRASNVAFLELDWTPATHDQAEDRCHRIGQSAAVNAWYLLAAETIDETIATLLERKRAIVAAVTDGREEDEEAVIDAVVRELRGAPYRHLRAVSEGAGSGAREAFEASGDAAPPRPRIVAMPELAAVSPA
jgi:SWI/SNF-related matrix-associated actin-dependent regulator 1 of chromatin subfamily A